MRKWMTAGLFAAVAMMTITGCSGKTDVSGTDTQTESSDAQEAETQAEETEPYVAESSIKLGEYKGIPVTVSKVSVTDDEVESQISRILSSKTEYIEVERAAELGDMVNMDFKGQLDGEAFEGGSAEAYDLILGSGRFIPGFEEGLVGLKKGDQKSLNLKFPEDYGNEEMNGKDVVFEVTVNAVKEKSVPVLSDEFVAKEYPEQGTEQKFRQELREEMEAQLQYEIDNQRDTDILTAIIENSEVVCSTDDVDKAYEYQLSAYTNMAKANGLDLATYAMFMGMDEAGFKKELREAARENAKQELVLREVAGKENITVTDEDREELAGKSGYGNAEALVAAFSQEEVDDTVLFQKTLKFLVDQAEITVLEGDEVPVLESGSDE